MKITNDIIMETMPKDISASGENIPKAPEMTELESEIVEILEENNVPVNEETVNEIKTFINEHNISLEDAKEAISYLIDKNIDINVKNLISVFNALNKDLKIDIKKDINLFKLPNKFKQKANKLKMDSLPNKEILKEVSKDRLKEMLKEALPIKEKEEVQKNSFDEEIKPLEFVDEMVSELLKEVENITNDISEIVTEDFFVKPLPVKKVIHMEVTEKMVKLESLFNAEKKSVLALIEKPEKISNNLLSAAIDKLDNIILKSDITLYTDMKTEKDLLHSSSELEIARNLLDNNREEAIKIIKRVYKKIESLSYKPSKQRMLLKTKKALYHNLYQNNMIDVIPIKGNVRGARNILEIFRSLGLNHEYELTEKLYDKKDTMDQFNLKKILLELKESNEKVIPKDSLDNLTGQQLLNKLEHKSFKQRMLFNIPIQIHNETKNLKIHVNARKENQKIDWKNSRLYFAVNLTNIGDTGILVDVFDRKVNVTIKNDTIDNSILSNLDDIKQSLSYIGYNINNISCSKLTHKENMKGIQLEL